MDIWNSSLRESGGSRNYPDFHRKLSRRLSIFFILDDLWTNTENVHWLLKEFLPVTSNILIQKGRSEILVQNICFSQTIPYCGVVLWTLRERVPPLPSISAPKKVANLSERCSCFSLRFEKLGKLLASTAEVLRKRKLVETSYRTDHQNDNQSLATKRNLCLLSQHFWLDEKEFFCLMKMDIQLKSAHRSKK